MSQLGTTQPVAGERLVLLQPAELDSVDHIKCAQRDMTRQLRDVLKFGLALDRNAVVLREFSAGVDAVLFVLPGGVVVGRVTDSAEAKKERASAQRARRLLRPGLYD